MAKFLIPCEWKLYGSYTIEADTLEEAIEEAEDAPLPDGSYLSDSFVIIEDDIENLT